MWFCSFSSCDQWISFPLLCKYKTQNKQKPNTHIPNCPQLSMMFSVKTDYVRAFHCWSCWRWKLLIVLGMGVVVQGHTLPPHYVVSEGRDLAFNTSAFWYSLLFPSINCTSLVSVRCYSSFINLVLIFKYSLNTEACTNSLHYCLVSPFPFDKTQETANPLVSWKLDLVGK